MQLESRTSSPGYAGVQSSYAGNELSGLELFSETVLQAVRSDTDGKTTLRKTSERSVEETRAAHANNCTSIITPQELKRQKSQHKCAVRPVRPNKERATENGKGSRPRKDRAELADLYELVYGRLQSQRQVDMSVEALANKFSDKEIRVLMSMNKIRKLS
jgi:hypothetical protein